MKHEGFLSLVNKKYGKVDVVQNLRTPSSRRRKNGEIKKSSG